jgi:DNA helicase-4
VVTDDAVEVASRKWQRRIPAPECGALRVKRRWFQWRLLVDDRPVLRLGFMAKREALTLDLALRRLPLAGQVAGAVSWHTEVTALLERHTSQQRWIPTESVERLHATRPQAALLGRIRGAECEGTFSTDELAAAAALDADLWGLVAVTNEQILQAELRDRRGFFDTIERSPLTEEQARAVVCFDNRVQLLAAAGSGKTSVMVARAAYAVRRGFMAPDRILLLAFNRAAAKELRERVVERFAEAGIDASGIRASTFHALGLHLIGQATGAKPRVPSWLEQDNGVGMVTRIVDGLRDASLSFRYRWDLYRTLLANSSTQLADGEPDAYDTATSITGYRTFGGAVVKSQGERVIADFLFLNGVSYEYERPYDVDVSDAEHSQYRPDFYYPDIGVWHEHFALDRDGSPPAEFPGYLEGIEWKRRVHAQHGTKLIETTWAGILWGDGLERLRETLTGLGLSLDWNPDRPVANAWATPMEHQALARQVRTFMAHVKSNSWTRADLEARLRSDMAHLRGFRTKVFLDLYWEIHEQWDRRLAADNTVDFEGMLVRAADYLDAGKAASRFDLVLVDEFQDASRARARMVQGLLRGPGKYLLAVGDDWQAINRFAGADLWVMTDFEAEFGRSQQLALTTTFRCPQSICDVASRFVTKNPSQFRKVMRSPRADRGATVLVLLDDNSATAVGRYLSELSRRVGDSSVPVGRNGKVTVDILGRYRRDRDLVPPEWPSDLEVTYRTVHGSKGLEADYVIVPNLTTGRFGFPSGIEDDPVVGLAMPRPESFPHAEERRLFYVALTRARHEVVLIAPPATMSPFVAELLRDPDVRVLGDGGQSVEICPGCGRGALVDRRGPYGAFVGCSRFPMCRYTARP